MNTTRFCLPLNFGPRFSKTATAALLGAALLATHAGAATIVNWGGDYVESTVALQTGATQASNAGKTLTYLYSTASPKSPASGYTAPAGKSGRFYGAFEVTSNNGSNGSFGTYSLVQNAGGDRIHVTGQTGAPATDTTNDTVGLIFFQKEDFLSGNDAETRVTLNAASSLTMGITNVPTGTRRLRAAVLALVDGEWDWYLSSKVYTGGAAQNITLADLGTSDWALWDIGTTTAPLNPAPTSFTVAGSSFEDIKAAGLYFSITLTSATAPGIQLNAIALDAAVTAIPEPGASALLLLAGLAIGSRRLKKGRVNARVG